MTPSSRRLFLQQAGMAAAALSISPFSVFGNFAKQNLGVQLFTFMGIIDNDVEGTLKKIAGLGYKDLESAFSLKGGYYGLKPKEFNSLANGLGLSWRSHHVLGTPFVPPPDMKLSFDVTQIRSLKMNMQALVDEAAEGGVPFLTCANIAIGSEDEIKQSVEILNKAGEACKKVGLTLAYHNHDAEFKKVGELIPYDYFLAQLSKDIMLELDLAWATKAGVDPVKLFKNNPGRFPMWHVKDLDTEFKNILPVGEGTIDFKRIFDNTKVSGMKYCFVEHDMPKDAFASVASSINYINSKILK
jgi:sugar phosphate isomerase/epimerase